MDRTPEGDWWSEARAIAARLARRGASDEAEDLAQDLAVVALETGAAARRPAAFLARSGKNAVIDGWRARRRREALAPEIAPPAGPRDPEAQLILRERRRAVRRGLLALPRAQRRAALLRFHGDLPFEAVAARLGTPPETARTRVHFGRRCSAFTATCRSRRWPPASARRPKPRAPACTGRWPRCARACRGCARCSRAGTGRRPPLSAWPP
jgi:RNA polymerase sigma-70 factor (ECF subfamily)